MLRLCFFRNDSEAIQRNCHVIACWSHFFNLYHHVAVSAKKKNLFLINKYQHAFYNWTIQTRCSPSCPSQKQNNRDRDFQSSLSSPNTVSDWYCKHKAVAELWPGNDCYLDATPKPYLHLWLQQQLLTEFKWTHRQYTYPELQLMPHHCRANGKTNPHTIRSCNLTEDWETHPPHVCWYISIRKMVDTDAVSSSVFKINAVQWCRPGWWSARGGWGLGYFKVVHLSLNLGCGYVGVGET